VLDRKTGKKVPFGFQVGEEVEYWLEATDNSDYPAVANAAGRFAASALDRFDFTAAIASANGQTTRGEILKLEIVEDLNKIADKINKAKEDEKKKGDAKPDKEQGNKGEKKDNPQNQGGMEKSKDQKQGDKKEQPKDKTGEGKESKDNKN